MTVYNLATWALVWPYLRVLYSPRSNQIIVSERDGIYLTLLWDFGQTLGLDGVEGTTI